MTMMTDLLDLWYVLLGLGLALAPILGLAWGFVEKAQLRRLERQQAERRAEYERLTQEATPR